MITRQPVKKLWHVLIAEDYPSLATHLRHVVEGDGLQPVGPASTVEDALHLISTHQVDAAILDVNLRGSLVTPVAEKLLELNIPFIFLTGYGNLKLLPNQFVDHPCVLKPADPQTILAQLYQAAGFDRTNNIR